MVPMDPYLDRVRLLVKGFWDRTGRTDIRYLFDGGGVGATDGCPRWLGGPVPVGSAVQGAACMKVQCNEDFFRCR